MSDNTTLNLGVGGDVIRTEDLGGVKMPVSKIHTGASDVDGGPVSAANPFPVSLVSGSVTVASGSLIGLLAGGAPVNSANPVPVSLQTQAAALVTTAFSGSITSLMVGGVINSPANPIPVSVQGVPNVSMTGGTQTNSGSLTGLLIGGLALNSANPVPVSVQGTPAVTLTSTTVSSGSVGLLVGGTAATALNPVPVLHLSGSVTGLLVGGLAVGTTNPVPVGPTVGGQIQSGSLVRTIQYAFADVGTSGSANQVVPPQGAGNRVRVVSAHVMTTNAVNARWQSTGSAGTITNISGLMSLPASGGFVLPPNEHGWLQTNVNEGLNISLDSAGHVGIVLTWYLAGT